MPFTALESLPYLRPGWKLTGAVFYRLTRRYDPKRSLDSKRFIMFYWPESPSHETTRSQSGFAELN